MTRWHMCGRVASTMLAAAAVGLVLTAVAWSRGGAPSATAITAAPPNCNDFSFLTPVNTVLTSSVSCTDPDGDPLTYAVDSSPSSGLLVLGASGSFTYTPDTGFSGDDSFGFTASDGTSSSFGFVTVRVGTNGAPVAVDDTYTVRTATARQLFVLDNDTDPDGDPVRDRAITNQTHGSSTGSQSSCTYTSDAGYVGPDSFTYTAADDFGGQDTATVSLTVETNLPPDAMDDDFTVTSGIGKQLFVLNNDSDPDGD